MISEYRGSYSQKYRERSSHTVYMIKAQENPIFSRSSEHKVSGREFPFSRTQRVKFVYD